MKIEVGKFYRTRTGLKAHVSHVCVFGDDGYPFRGDVCSTFYVYVPVSWTESGIYNTGNSEWDLVAEWEDEPEKCEDEPEKPAIEPGWYAVTRACTGGLNTSAIVVYRSIDGVLWWRYASTFRLYKVRDGEFADAVRLEPIIERPNPDMSHRGQSGNEDE